MRFDRVAWNHRGSQIACDAAGSFAIWDAADHRPRATIADAGGGVRMLAVRPKASGWRPAARRPRSTATRFGFGRPTATWAPACSKPIRRSDALAWSPDGRWLATGGRDWKIACGSPTARLGRSSRAIAAESWRPIGAPTAKRLPPDRPDKSIRLWQPPNPKAIKTILQESPVDSVAWSPDGKRFASSCWRASPRTSRGYGCGPPRAIRVRPSRARHDAKSVPVEPRWPATGRLT